MFALRASEHWHIKLLIKLSKTQDILHFDVNAQNRGAGLNGERDGVKRDWASSAKSRENTFDTCQCLDDARAWPVSARAAATSFWVE